MTFNLTKNNEPRKQIMLLNLDFSIHDFFCVFVFLFHFMV